MICINKGQNQYEVVDGQQRLTTLSIIVSELKKQISIQGVKDDLQKRVLPIDVYSDEAEEPRLVVRKKEYELYKYYILQDLKNYKPEKPSDTDLVFISNAEVIRDYLAKLSDDELKLLAKYILQNVYIVFVQTDDFASSFRLFNVLNSRGLPLSNADLLKNALLSLRLHIIKNLNKLNLHGPKLRIWLVLEGLISFLHFTNFQRRKIVTGFYKKDLNPLLRIYKKNLMAMLSRCR